MPPARETSGLVAWGAWPDCFERAMNRLRRGCACRSAQPDVLLRQSAPLMSLLMECLAWHQQVDEGAAICLQYLEGCIDTAPPPFGMHLLAGRSVKCNF